MIIGFLLCLCVLTVVLLVVGLVAAILAALFSCDHVWEPTVLEYNWTTGKFIFTRTCSRCGLKEEEARIESVSRVDIYVQEENNEASL